MYLSVSRPVWKNYGVVAALDSALEIFGDNSDIKTPTDRQVWDRSITFAKSLITHYKDKKGFIIGFLPDETEALLKEAFEEQYQDGEECIPFFTEEEKNDLLIKKGTLNKREREIMESHVEVTEKILSKVRFNATYKKAAQFAVEHHECLNGTGYPQKLSGEVLELESRILAVADICDALLATDRAYKKPMPKEKAFAIMHDMANEGKIDGILVGYLEHCIS
jgi:hypothetical protein